MAFQYQSLGLDEIRLLQVLPGTDTEPLQARLCHVALTDIDKKGITKTRYDGLSYTWEDSRDNEKITLNDMSFEVTQNLADALREIRRSDYTLQRNRTLPPTIEELIHTFPGSGVSTFTCDDVEYETTSKSVRLEAYFDLLQLTSDDSSKVVTRVATDERLSDCCENCGQPVIEPERIPTEVNNELSQLPDSIAAIFDMRRFASSISGIEYSSDGACSRALSKCIYCCYASLHTCTEHAQNIARRCYRLLNPACTGDVAKSSVPAADIFSVLLELKQEIHDVLDTATDLNITLTKHRLMSIPDELLFDTCVRHSSMIFALEQFYIWIMPQFIWIDAICINQQDLAERSREISKMLIIYEKATRVIIWLGAEANNSDQAINFIETSVSKWRELGSDIVPWLESFHKSAQYHETRLALVRLFSHPWFSRTWIVQEYIACKAARSSVDGDSWLMCGSARLTTGQLTSWHELQTVPAMKSLLMSLHDDASLIMTSEESTGGGLWSASDLDNFTNSLLARFMHGQTCFYRLEDARAFHRDGKYDEIMTDRNSFLPWLQRFRYASATDPRDKIYGLLGLVGWTDKKAAQPLISDINVDALLIDYSASVEDVYASVVRASILATQRLLILSACSNRGPLISRTWIPDWSRERTRTSLLRLSILGLKQVASDPWKASGDSKATAMVSDDLSTLKVKGLYLDKVFRALGIGKSFMFPDGHSPTPAMRSQHLRIMTKYAIELLDIFSAYATPAENRNALWRSLVANSFKGQQGDVPAEWADEFEAWLDKEYEQMVPYSEQNPSNWIKNHYEDHVYEPDDPTYKANVQDNMTHRDLILVSRGYVGVAPSEVKDGDALCILLGCDVPMILRPREDSTFELIGEAYIHGIMHGEHLSTYPPSEEDYMFFTLV